MTLTIKSSKKIKLVQNSRSQCSINGSKLSKKQDVAPNNCQHIKISMVVIQWIFFGVLEVQLINNK